MQGLFQGIKKLFTYKEPKNTELGFELLERSSEGVDHKVEKPDINQISKQHTKLQKNAENQKEHKTKKAPLPISEWNEERNVIQKQPTKSSKQKENTVASELHINIEYLKQRFNMPQNQDIVIREFNIARKINALLLFVDGMVDKNDINQFILPQLMDVQNFIDFDWDQNAEHITGYIINNIISISQIAKSSDLDSITLDVLRGDTALFIDGTNECLLIRNRGFEKRNIDRPQTETVIRGSQEAFTENTRTNLTLLRRVIKNENFITEIVKVSKTNNATCAIAYVKGIADPELIKEVKKRLNSIHVDFIEGDGMVEQLIEDNPFSIFPQILSTERPDRAASFLMEGKVLLITEGTPFALAAPVTFFHLFHTSEDSFLRWQYGTFLRFIRIVGTLISLLLPGLYIALILYHHEMIPTRLLVSVLRAEELVPFPIIAEILMLELSFELIREGGIRVPGVIGNTLGIIGALILGQAAVAAGLVSPILIIIVAVTGIGSFVVPDYSLSLGIRILRFVVVLFGALAGFYGISLIIVALGFVSCSLKSFGVPFFSPSAPKTKTNPDILIRQPIWKQQMRPDYLNTPNRRRQGKTPRGWVKNNGGNRK